MSDRVVGESSVVIGEIRPADPVSEADADLVLITDYLAGALEPGEVAAVERRLRVDEGFRRRVEPLMAAWRLTEASGALSLADGKTAFDDLRKRLREARDEDGIARAVKASRPSPLLQENDSRTNDTARTSWLQVLPPLWLAKCAFLCILTIAAILLLLRAATTSW
jgi:hypothetical protein